MKFFKKAKELFDRLTVRDDAPPPVRPPATVEAEVILDPRYKYRRLQRDFERRAAERTVVHTGGTFNAGRNKTKRATRRRHDYLKLILTNGGWKRTVRLLAARERRRASLAVAA